MERGGTELINFERLDKLSKELVNTEIDMNCLNAVPVTGNQIVKLKSQGCCCSNWSKILLTPASDLNLISNCNFFGSVSIHLPEGYLTDTAFENCLIEGPVKVRSNTSISSMTLLSDSTVEYNGTILWDSSSEVMGCFMNIGVETGERQVPILPHFDHNEVAFLGSANGRIEVNECILFRNQITDKLKGFIGKGAFVSHNSLIQNSILLEKSIVNNATAVRGSILLQGASVTDGALVRNSVLQWNSTADSFAIVENSIVGECSLVERHGKLTDSFLGADSVLGEGEVTACLVGPLTGMHHQSLLIAAMWPGGKGNIGYGANVGSNHTSRLPDQEIKPGTGLFFGLSTSVKFPSDFSASPYSIIATGLTTLPQKMSFPFSLVTLAHKRPDNVPDGWCQLIPGWMLSDNLYSVLRNQWKYANRLKAVHTDVETQVFTDEILDMVKETKKRLERNSIDNMPGIGKNFITEDHRLKGIEAYRKCIRGAELWKKYKGKSLNSSETGEMLDLLLHVKNSTISSRMKDYKRGDRIIDDYLAVREPPDQDKFIQVLEAFCVKITEQLNLMNPTEKTGN